MPSPACQVKNGAGAYGPTTNGVNVTPTNTITINLLSSAGVSTWSISCVSTDETSDAVTVTSSLVIDSVAKTATFTAPTAGKAYIFQSQINGGVDANGVAQSSYTTTFGIYTLTAGGRRVHAVNETFESHATFGWVADINDVIRNPVAVTPSGTGFRKIVSGVEQASAEPVDLADATECTGTLPATRGGTGITSLGSGVATFLGTPSSANLRSALTDETGSGSAVFATSPTLTTPTINTPTIDAPTISGTVTFSSTSMQATGNARARAYSDIANVQTTDATVTSLFTWTILDEACTKVVAEVCGDRSTGAETAAYVRQARIKRDGGTVTVGTVDTPFTSEEVSTWDCTIDNSTSTGRVRVTGVAAVTIDWGGIISRLEVSHA